MLDKTNIEKILERFNLSKVDLEIYTSTFENMWKVFEPVYSSVDDSYNSKHIYHVFRRCMEMVNWLKFNTRNFKDNKETTYLNYVYSFQDKRCEKMTIGNKKYYLDKQADGSLLVERNFDTDAGVVSETLSEIKGVEYQHVFAETYGGCMLYVDAIILNKEIKDKKAYANLKDPKFK